MNDDPTITTAADAAKPLKPELPDEIQCPACRNVYYVGEGEHADALQKLPAITVEGLLADCEAIHDELDVMRKFNANAVLRIAALELALEPFAKLLGGVNLDKFDGSKQVIQMITVQMVKDAQDALRKESHA